VSRLAAASRIVQIQEILTVESFLGMQKRRELMFEQENLWDEHFEGRSFDEIAKDAWMHKLLRWG
jgi:hypothetical protein